MMQVDPIDVDGLSFILILLVLPFVSFGTMNDQVVLWGLGLGLLVIGSLVPLITEFWIRENQEE